MPSRFDYADPGTDQEYCNGLGRAGSAPRVPPAPTVTRERTMHELHKAMHEALTLTIQSPNYAALALTARTLLADIAHTIQLGEEH